MSTNGRDTIEPETSRLLTQEAKDLRDHNDEKNGATHKPRRFVADTDTEESRNDQRLKALFKNTMTLLQMRLTDPAYRALYEQVEARLAEAEAQLAIAKEQALNDAARDADKLEDVKSEAVRLPDGRVIFRDKHGKARYDTGALVDPALLTPELQRRLEQGPTYEDYQGKAEEARNSTRRVEQIDAIEHQIIIPARREISDPDKPPSMDALKNIQTRIDEATKNLTATKVMQSAEQMQATGQAPNHVVAAAMPNVVVAP